jgi:cell division septum initiation protein DivIVA
MKKIQEIKNWLYYRLPYVSQDWIDERQENKQLKIFIKELESQIAQQARMVEFTAQTMGKEAAENAMKEKYLPLLWTVIEQLNTELLKTNRRKARRYGIKIDQEWIQLTKKEKVEYESLTEDGSGLLRRKIVEERRKDTEYLIKWLSFLFSAIALMVSILAYRKK